MKVEHSSQKGRFNLLGNEQEEQVTLNSPVGRVSLRWPVGECSYAESMFPSEVSALLRERLESYFIKTDREEVRARLDAFDKQAKAFDAAWARARAASLRLQAQMLLRESAMLESTAHELDACEPHKESAQV